MWVFNLDYEMINNLLVLLYSHVKVDLLCEGFEGDDEGLQFLEHLFHLSVEKISKIG